MFHEQQSCLDDIAIKAYPERHEAHSSETFFCRLGFPAPGLMSRRLDSRAGSIERVFRRADGDISRHFQVCVPAPNTSRRICRGTLKKDMLPSPAMEKTSSNTRTKARRHDEGRERRVHKKAAGATRGRTSSRQERNRKRLHIHLADRDLL